MTTPKYLRLFLLFVLAIWPSFAAAQTDEEAPPAKLSAEELTKRLESLRQELKQEEAALEELDQRHQQELDNLQQQRRDLADKLLDAQIQRQQNTTELEGLEQQAEEVTAQSKEVVQQAQRIPRLFRQAAEQLLLHLREVPGSDATAEELRVAASKLKWSPESPPDEQTQAALQTVIRILNQTHDQSMQVRVSEADIFTVDGTEETVKLFSLGHVAFAYQTLDGRLGITLSSPRNASGYRWSENLDSAEQELLRQAIATVESGEAGLITPPIDPTGRIQPETLHAEPSLWERLTGGGFVMLPLLGVALVACFLILERAFVLYGWNPRIDALVKKVVAACEQQKFEEAQRMCDRQRGSVAQVLSACLVRRRYGQQMMEDSIQEQLLHEMPKLQRFLGAIAVLAGIAPLLGLLGTVTGIIRTFDVIQAFGNSNPALMASGISEALITTATGLVIAVPILIFHTMLRGRVDQILADAERYGATLLTTLVIAQQPAMSQNHHPQKVSAEAQPQPTAVEAPSEEATVD